MNSKKEHLLIFLIFLSNELLLNGYYYGEVTITLVNAPLLNPKYGPEYCQSDIIVSFGTYDELQEREITSKTKNLFRRDGSLNLLHPNNYSKKELKGSYLYEYQLINKGNKYHPVKKYILNLSKVKESIKINNLKYPKKWYLKIEGIYRDKIIQMLDNNLNGLKQNFSLIITIKDDKRKYNIYDIVTRTLEIKNFPHRNINLRSTIRVGVN